MNKTTSGFTIVELLIVIVVIAILATISVVAYNGIQNRANDSIIQSDLNNFAKKALLVAADTGEFPPGGSTQTSSTTATGDSTIFPGFTFKPSRTSYMTTESNLIYCTGTETASGQRISRVQARSKSGMLYQHSSNVGLQNLGSSTPASFAGACQGISYPNTAAYGYYVTTNTWWSWTNG